MDQSIHIEASAHTSISYLDDDAATQAAITEDGYFMTGDHARRVGDDIVIEGRISTDCTFFRTLFAPFKFYGDPWLIFRQLYDITVSKSLLLR